jgi:iron complex outermembrane receptor protein
VAATAQAPDSARVLPELTVRAVRDPSLPGTTGWSLTVLHGDTLRRGRAAPLLDDLLAFVPGVIARERPDRSLDTRIAIRGAGARANFGVRGVKVLVDGIPATLPDGQTPLTFLDLEHVARIEVARGPVAALHGNGAHGVVALTTTARGGNGPFLTGNVGIESGVEGPLRRGMIALGTGSANIGGRVSASRLVSDGAREHAYAAQQRYHGALDWRAGPRTQLTLRGGWALDDSVEAPGALTLDEFLDDASRAATNSVLREAGKAISQRQLSATLSHDRDRLGVEAATWVLGRTLENPLAAPAPPPTTPTQGTWVGLDRLAWGARSTGRYVSGRGLRVIAGIDLQAMRDERINRRHDAGVPQGTAFLDQREAVVELGVFSQLAVALGSSWLVRGGARHDAVRFTVTDRLDAARGGQRTMRAWSASAAVTRQFRGWEAWAGGGTAFETPTTTELANQPDGGTGLNRDLGPARTVSAEVGIRQRGATRAVEVVAFASVTRDAITPVAEAGGRSYFANRGRTRTQGVEAAGTWRLTDALVATAALTLLRARFGRGGTASDGSDLEGRTVPGIAPLTGRLGLAWTHAGWRVDVDQAWSGAITADDRNTLELPGWGAGITTVHLARRDLVGGIGVAAGIRNLFDRRHAIGAVVNGAGGRVVEPGAGRTFTVAVSWAPGS